MATWRGVDELLAQYGQSLLALGQSIDGSLTLTSGRRTSVDQARLYEAWLQRGRTGLPALPPGSSRHELGLAFDLARPRVDPFEDDLLSALGEVWNWLGGHWSAKDPVHFQ